VTDPVADAHDDPVEPTATLGAEAAGDADVG
jgi:hypothetical protein